jgi:hypothetical protein
MTHGNEAEEAARVVSAQWQQVLAYDSYTVDPAVPRAAFAHPRLRELFPMVSHGILYLSRCTQYPWTHDVATAFPKRPVVTACAGNQTTLSSARSRPWRRLTS